MGIFRILLLGLCLTGIQPTMVSAQSAKEQAKALFLQGRDHFVAERYADALRAFEQANTLTPHPLMLLNIAKVYEAMNDLSSAIASYNAYLQSTESAEIKTKVATLNAQLATWPAVEVSTVPSGAEVRVGDRSYSPRGNTPARLKLPPGNHTLFFDLPGYQPVQRKVSLLKGARSKVSIAMQAALSMVSVSTNPPGARVEINGQGLPGVSPTTGAFRQGRIQVTVTAPGFAPLTQEAVLGPQHTSASPLALSFDLQQAQTGFLMVAVSQVGAEIKVDGQIRGVSPLSNPINLTPGMHQLEVSLNGKSIHSEIVGIQVGQTTNTNVDSSPSKPIDFRRVSLVGMGVGGLVFAGGVALGIMALSADGDLNDCRQNAQCAHTQEERALSDDVKSQSLTADILMGSGVAIAGAFAAYYFLNPEPATTTQATISLVPQKGGTFFSGAWTF